MYSCTWKAKWKMVEFTYLATKRTQLIMNKWTTSNLIAIHSSLGTLSSKIDRNMKFDYFKV